ncbi:helix-turn-helix domain-containing protein [Saccharibacillus sp. CPCC 101409]|uniref:helix-turn-helix domain-containing protein n=1 Tax=Saccharibacillus sp. CPCC 101409 TaxID=3058041 RepID=UPI002670D500|nr:helix-turn-helix domain-containing protein [Saccharibacillus sp. CPCC 101409]MDO3412864.1 helix-turn-helix domain-containing protein [Saccharibacillus sp. CPCC 101409]
MNNYDVQIDVSEIYELLGSFMVHVTKKWLQNLDIGSDWSAAAEDGMPPDLRRRFDEAAGWPFLDFDALYALVIERETGEDIPAFLERLFTEPAQNLLDRIAGQLPLLTPADMERIQRDYTPLLKSWYTYYFQDIRDSILPLMEEDAAEKRELLLKMDPSALVEYASGGLVIETPLDLRTVILFPTVHNRPMNTYCFYRSVLLIQYPVDAPEAHEDEPPTVLLRMTRALAMPDRLKLLRYVADQPRSLQEMERDLGQPAEALKHHMVLLRTAGLLRTHIGEQFNEKFSIRPDGASELQMFLESYLRL